MINVIVGGLGILVGFIIGALVFHNNEKVGNPLIDNLQQDVNKISSAATAVAKDVKSA